MQFEVKINKLLKIKMEIHTGKFIDGCIFSTRL